ncbi:MAG: hypothetical protein U9Q62_09960 [Campylobacterota bacterium]|nr:hypothetical protein [Campylobacterota bacterium]
MPLISQCRTDKSTIVHLQQLENGDIGVVTANDGVYLLEHATCKIITHLKIDELEPHAHGIAFSPDGGYFAFSHETSKGHALRLIDIESKRLIRSYATQENSIEQLSFDPSSTYIVAGTSTGRVFLWRVDGINLIARLSSFPEFTPTMLTAPTHNYVSAIAFSDTMVATSGYGGSIVVTNLRSQANTRRLKPGRRRIDAICFMDDNHLISGNEDGLIELIHIEEHHPIKRVPTTIGAIAHLQYFSENKFLLAASKYNHIALINIATMEVADNHYIATDSPIRAMTRNAPNSLLIGLENGEIKQAELSPFSEFDLLVDDENYRLAYAMADHEPIIRSSVAFQKMDERFHLAYNKALRALASGRHDDAKIFLIPFGKVPQKSHKIQMLFNAFDNFPRFKHLIKETKYAAAYGLSVQYPSLQQTKSYANLEEQWEKAFTKAQKLIIKGDEAHAKAAFADFLTVPAKSTFIRLLLHRTKVVIAFSKAIHARDFITLKKLTENDPVLCDTPSYKAIIASADEMIESIMRAIKTNQFEKASQLADELKQIPHLTHHYDHIVQFLQKAERLQLNLEKGNKQRYYELLDRSSELSVLPQAKKMEKAWEKMIESCEEAVIAGNTASLKEILGELITLSTRSDKIGNLLRSSYQMQLKYYLTRHEYEMMKQGIEQYVFLFGMDNETYQLIRLLNEEGEGFSLSEEQTQHRPRSLWLTLTQGKLPDDIAKFQ